MDRVFYLLNVWRFLSSVKLFAIYCFISDPLDVFISLCYRLVFIWFWSNYYLNQKFLHFYFHLQIFGSPYFYCYCCIFFVHCYWFSYSFLISSYVISFLIIWKKITLTTKITVKKKKKLIWTDSLLSRYTNFHSWKS